MQGFACAPLLLTVFNRPDKTRLVLDRIKEVQPEVVLVAADGPRSNVVQDVSRCEEVRQIIKKEINWPAKVMADFAPHNLGLRCRMNSAISWALAHYDRIIVLEDDCLPEVSFFRFCTELLERYADDLRVGAITGDNFQPSGFNCSASYYFSRYPHCWGWATWRRAWKLNDGEMSDWRAVKQTEWLGSLFPHPLEALYWKQIFDDTACGKIQTWDYQWTYACWRHSMLTATPRHNLITNIGTGATATNTRDAETDKHGKPSFPLGFPMLHPPHILRDTGADNYVQKYHYGRAKDPSIRGAARRLLKKGTAFVAKRIKRVG
jgi:hypothetical protein